MLFKNGSVVWLVQTDYLSARERSKQVLAQHYIRDSTLVRDIRTRVRRAVSCLMGVHVQW